MLDWVNVQCLVMFQTDLEGAMSVSIDNPGHPSPDDPEKPVEYWVGRPTASFYLGDMRMRTNTHDTARSDPRGRRPLRTIASAAALCLSVCHAQLAVCQTANESGRDIPIAYDVDVLVVGGSSAGVAAAVAAAKEGAKVFVAAPRPYLGEDICATYRLWLEADEEPRDPLAKELFNVPAPLEGIEYTYQADRASSAKHKDTQPPGMLGDGQWGTAFTESVQYDKDVTISMKDSSFASFAEAEQVARDRTFDLKQVDESEILFQVPPDPIKGEASLSGAWPGATKAEMAAFRPKGMSRMLVLGACADVSREAAVKLIRPLQLIAMGRRIGVAAAEEARTILVLAGVRVPGVTSVSAASGDVGEALASLRAAQHNVPTLRAEAGSIPVIGEYDVVVIGGGTAGAPAGIGSARQGAKTLVVEYLHGLGGVGTTGLIGIYCAGYRKGVTEETEAGIKEIGSPSYVIGKKEWWRGEIRKAGGDIWFGTLGCGALVENGKVKGAVVATPEGRGVVLCHTLIDGTGHADVAAAAGAECMYTDGEHIALQGAGLPGTEPGATYINTDWTFVDESDMIDVWSAYVVAKDKYPGAYDLGQLIDTRERRRIVGDYVLTPLDIVNQRKFPDTIGISNGGKLDKHGYTVHPFYMINNWRGGMTYTPYRCLLPKGLDGILVIGIGLSAHCDAIPSIRMQPGVQNLGYAAGVAAAMATRNGASTRDIDVKALQAHLVGKACLTPEVAKHEDSFPLPDSKVEAAVRALVENDYSGLGAIIASEDRSIPMMQVAYRSAATSAEGKLRCAHVLGILGDATGIETLIAKVRSAKEFDEERIDVYFPWVTWLDSYLIALGRTGDSRALDPLLEKMALLGNGKGNVVSHYRALGLAFEALRHPAAAKPLGEAMKKLGILGMAVTETAGLTSGDRGKTGQRDLTLARVLYRLGDHEGIGKKILQEYARDVRGHYARHAHAVLKEGPFPRE